MNAQARAAAEHAARSSYGRLVALLAAPTGDLALAEDALSGAFEEALRRWPAQGVPDNPEGWLLTVARTGSATSGSRPQPVPQCRSRTGTPCTTLWPTTTP